MEASGRVSANIYQPNNTKNAGSQNTRRQRQLLVQHAFMAYMATLAHIPVMVWQVGEKLVYLHTFHATEPSS